MPTVTTKPRNVSWSEDHMYFVIESDKFSGTAAPYTPTHANLSCYVEVWEKDRETDEDRFLVSLDVPYDPYTKSAVFDVRSIQELKPHLPDLTTTSGVATSTLGLLWIKYADKFGSPAVPDTLATDNNGSLFYVTIFGSTRISIADEPNKYGFGLHAYKTADNAGIGRLKEISPAQRDWIYVYLGRTGDYEVQTKIFYKDGTDETKTETITSLSGKKIHWIEASYSKRVAPVTKEVLSFTITVFYPLQTKIITIISYKLVPCIESEKYLAFFNGIGAIETQRMTGKHTTDIRATREKIMRTEYGAVSRSKGLISSYNPSGQEIYNYNSGYISKDEAYHLRQILMTDAWEIEGTEVAGTIAEFHALSPLTSEIKEVKKSRADNESLHSLEISYEDTVYTTTAVPRKI